MTSATASSSPRQAKGREPREFSLVRHFSITCLVLFLFVTTVMCAGFYQISKRYIRTDTEHHAVPIAGWLAQFAFREGRPFPMPDTPEWAELDREMRAVLDPLQIIKVKIYSTDRRIIYTTDPQIPYGRPDPDNAKLALSLSGRVVSSMQTHADLWDLQEESREGSAIVEAYVPVYGAAGQVVGVTEVYQDVSTTYARLPLVILIIVVASVLAMGTLYVSLLFIVRRADLIIRAQTRTIREANERLEAYAGELERRVEDRTQQLKESLAQQRQDDKMVATGTLAAGVAHELNTPLGTILASVQMVLEQCPPGSGDPYSTFHPDLKRIETQARRCSEIVGGLVRFSRMSNSERASEDLRDLIEQSVFLLEPNARRNGVRIVKELAPLPRVVVSGNEIQQVVVNLMTNGMDAMQEGGVLTVRLRREGVHAVMQVEDDGAGISEAALERIFEPFYTTKEVGRGTGLGLAICYRIVNEHGGRIYAESAVGRGTTFTVELPLAASGPGAAGGRERSDA